MTVWQQVITIGLCVAGTMLTRFLPFLIFKEDGKTPGFVQYIGKYLPSAVFGMLVVYCLKNVDVLEGNHGLPELIAILVTGALHVWKRQMLLSIAGGTVCYMITDAYAGSYTVAEDGVTVTIKGLTNVDTTSQYTIPGLWSYIAMVKQQNVKLAHRKYIG